MTEGRQASAVTLAAGIAVGECCFIKTSDLYTCNVTFSNICVVLFLQYIFSQPVFEETLPPLDTPQKRTVTGNQTQTSLQIYVHIFL